MLLEEYLKPRGLAQVDHDLWHALRKRAEAGAKPQLPKGHGKYQAP